MITRRSILWMSHKLVTNQPDCKANNLISVLSARTQI